MDMKECFVICPIGEADSDTRKRSDQLMRHVFEPVLKEKNYSAVRADKVPKAGLITSQIINLVIESPLVIADLTDSNPNVFYELAIRHVTRKPFIQIAHKGNRIPFDIAGVRTIEVDLGNPDSVVAAKNELASQIDEFHKGHIADSPISVATSVRLLQTDSIFAENIVKRIDLLMGTGLTSIDDLDEKIDNLDDRMERIIALLESVEDRLE